jgi:hypothetical protein
MRTITLESYGKSEVDAFTDCYAEKHGSVILLSIIGNDSVLKAISATLIDNRRNSTLELYVEDEKHWRGRKCLFRDPRATYKVTTAKLRSGLSHQLIYDERFFRANEKDQDSYDRGTRYVLVKPGENEADLVYHSVLKGLPTPTLPEWSHAIYGGLQAQDDDLWSSTSGRIKKIDTYPEEVKVISVQVTEEALDSVVSDLVKRGVIGWE